MPADQTPRRLSLFILISLVLRAVQYRAALPQGLLAFYAEQAPCAPLRATIPVAVYPPSSAVVAGHFRGGSMACPAAPWQHLHMASPLLDRRCTGMGLDRRRASISTLRLSRSTA